MVETVEVTIPGNGWRARPYQRNLWRYLDRGGRHAVAVWHRRAGKDDVALHHGCKSAHRRKGNYWHMLPEYAQARKAIWDAINPHSGMRRIDEAFPQALRKSTNNHEMKIEFHCGSIWQVVGSDNFNSLVGSPPVGITYSEWSVANPLAHAYLSPILAENKGWALFIYTARGYNHGHSTYEAARSDPQAFAELLTVDDTAAIDPEALEQQRQTYIALYGPEAGESFYRQEFFNDWSASNIGAILGAAVERADRAGRIVDDLDDDDGEIHVSSDIGFRDTASWWFWRQRLGGFDLIDYDQGIGLDADDWIERLQAKPHKLAGIWLPHDARVKTFQSKHSSVERLVSAFGVSRVHIVPQTKKADRINAARRVIERCRFDRARCKDGLAGLRSWAYEWDEEKKIMSAEPRHDWASHPGDAYSYGCQVMEERVLPLVKPTAAEVIAKAASRKLTFNDAIKLHDRSRSQRARV